VLALHNKDFNKHTTVLITFMISKQALLNTPFGAAGDAIGVLLSSSRYYAILETCTDMVGLGQAQFQCSW